MLQQDIQIEKRNRIGFSFFVRYVFQKEEENRQSQQAKTTIKPYFENYIGSTNDTTKIIFDFLAASLKS